MPRNLAAAATAVLILGTGWGWQPPFARSAAGPAADRPSSVEGVVPPDAPLVVTVPAPPEARLRSVLISLEEPGRIEPGLRIATSVGPADDRLAGGPTVTKDLHLGDPDVAWMIRQPKG